MGEYYGVVRAPNYLSHALERGSGGVAVYNNHKYEEDCSLQKAVRDLAALEAVVAEDLEKDPVVLAVVEVLRQKARAFLLKALSLKQLSHRKALSITGTLVPEL